MLEALHAHADGHSLESIDAAAKEFGMPVGPVELADRVGLDVALHVAEILSGVLATPPPELLRAKVAKGELGVKTGRGFYAYDAHGKPIKERGRSAFDVELARPAPAASHQRSCRLPARRRRSGCRSIGCRRHFRCGIRAVHGWPASLRKSTRHGQSRREARAFRAAFWDALHTSRGLAKAPQRRVKPSALGFSDAVLDFRPLIAFLHI